MHEQTTLKDKRILVTGGTTGIGLATVALLAQEGARVLTFGRHQAGLDDALASADSASGTVEGLIADASTKEGIDAVFAEMDEKFGGIDMLVSCAAIGAQPIHEMEDDDWRYVIETNLIGTLAAARGAIDRQIWISDIRRLTNGPQNDRDWERHGRTAFAVHRAGPPFPVEENGSGKRTVANTVCAMVSSCQDFPLLDRKPGRSQHGQVTCRISVVRDDAGLGAL
ncbi:SDR family NAD(P)-dependent oxidoreductase [Sphingomonas sp. IW22]|uniref:SDR family NAD(P)-dependent oxidoreductase n=1 Tax=Sphingomonas sp. IW22 TaxID=3242489 RepID=UPI003520E824